MFRNKLPAEIILGVLCLIVGSVVIGFMTLAFDLFDGNYRERFSYISREKLIFVGISFLGSLISIVCSYGLFKQKRWAVILISLLLLSIMLIAIFTIIGESRFFMRDHAQALILSLVGIGFPLCFLLLFNSTRVFPWLAPRNENIKDDVLDEF